MDGDTAAPVLAREAKPFASVAAYTNALDAHGTGMKRTFSIFISSVQGELAAERRAVKDFVTNDPLLRRFFPDVFLFEDQPARDRRADETYLGEVGRRDIYLGLFGRTYGQKGDDGLSPTHREFAHATANKRERLIYIVGKDEGRDPGMTALIAKANAQVIRRRAADIPGLLREVYASLVDFIDEHGLLRLAPFDSAACHGAALGDVSEANVKAFLAAADARGRLSYRGAASPKSVLTHFHLLADAKPTNAAILLFGRDPTRLLNKTQLHCLQFHGTAKKKPIASQQVFEGTLFETVDRALNFVLSTLAAPVGLATTGAAATVEPEIPVPVIREALVNAVAHRDYESDGFVQVLVFADRVEVWNPGKLPAGLSEADLLEPHGPIPRNPLIAEPLFRAGYAEKAGTGTTDMVELCRAAGLPAPDFAQHGPHFVVTLWRDWLTAETLARLELNERQIKAVAQVKARGRITNTELQALAATTRKTAARDLEALVAKGLFRLVGAKRGSHYVLERKK